MFRHRLSNQIDNPSQVHLHTMAVPAINFTTAYFPSTATAGGVQECQNSGELPKLHAFYYASLAVVEISWFTGMNSNPFKRPETNRKPTTIMHSLQE